MPFEPDRNWYTDQSKKKGITPRCPFAAIERCPRYYFSLSLMGSEGFSTPIEASTDARVKEKWQRSDLWPATDEQSPMIEGSPGKKDFTKFCPEVIYDRFGLFAENLWSYADELDRSILSAHDGSCLPNWQYRWESLTPLHYSDCNLYSLLRENPHGPNNALPRERPKHKAGRKRATPSKEEFDIDKRYYEAHSRGIKRKEFAAREKITDTKLKYILQKVTRYKARGKRN